MGRKVLLEKRAPQVVWVHQVKWALQAQPVQLVSRGQLGCKALSARKVFRALPARWARQVQPA